MRYYLYLCAYTSAALCALLICSGIVGAPFAIVEGLEAEADYAEEKGAWCEKQLIKDPEYDNPDCDMSNIESAAVNYGLQQALIRLAEIAGPTLGVGGFCLLCLAITSAVLLKRKGNESQESLGDDEPLKNKAMRRENYRSADHN